MQTILKHKAILAGVLIVVAFGIWYMVSSSDSPSDAVLTNAGESDVTGGADDQIVKTLLTLQAITLDGSILNDPTFQGLKDFSTQIVSEPVGRTDPFAPFSGAVVVAPAANPSLFSPKK